MPLHKFGGEDVRQLRKIFSQVDVDNDKELTHSELVTVLERWGLENVTEAEVATLVSRFDVDKSGTLDFEEFLGLAWSAKSLSEGDDATMEMTIQTHFAREHAKVKSLMVRQKLAVDAATLRATRGRCRGEASILE